MLDTFEDKDDLWETAENLTFDKGLLKEGGSLTFATAGVYRQDGCNFSERCQQKLSYEDCWCQKFSHSARVLLKDHKVCPAEGPPARSRGPLDF